MSEDVKRKDRPGDQPLPVPNDGPVMHDLLCADLEARAAWAPAERISDIAEHVQARKQLGLDRYGSFLQAHNGRDALLDLEEELIDAAVYARQVQEERGSQDIGPVYDALIADLICVRRLRDELT